MILTKELWTYFWSKQVELDEAFAAKARWQPTLSDRKLAYRIEKAEFINEFAEQVKWWKHTENDVPRIMDEFGDMIHFVAGYSIARYCGGIVWGGVTIFSGRDKLTAYLKISDFYDKYANAWMQYNTKKLLKVLIKTNNPYKSFALALLILETDLKVTADDLRQAYDQKNEENFKRIAAGY